MWQRELHYLNSDDVNLMKDGTDINYKNNTAFVCYEGKQLWLSLSNVGITCIEALNIIQADVY